MQFREISWQSDEYQQACELRNTILRRPLGMIPASTAWPTVHV